MPYKKEQFVITEDNLAQAIDVDDSAGRSVPINMNFTETGYLSKDTGSSLFGSTEADDECHSIFNYKKKDGTSYFLRSKGMVLQKYNTSTSVWDDLSTSIGTVTMTIASPAVATKTAHGLAAGNIIYFTTTGALPTGVTANTPYYVISTGLTANDFQFSATLGGSAVNTSGAQSGTHTLKRYYTEGAKFGFVVYNDILYGGNGEEPTFSYDGTTFTEISSAPRGNIFEVFEDRLFISGVETGTGIVGSCTMTIASPAVVTKTSHRLVAGDKITFTTDGALPTGVTAGTTYYVIAAGLTADAFQFSASSGGAAVNTSGSQSGTHTLYVLEKPQPLSVYYSNIGDPLTWSTADILQPVGTDSVTGLENYYGALLIFKQETIWKLTFVFDSVVSLYLPKLELQSGTYGACSKKAITWVENDIWFFTGREVRSIGFKDQQLGVLGVNSSVLSDQIKETLKTISTSNFSKVSVAYSNRRFYLCIPLEEDYNDTVFVCHILYKNSWTKYTDRIKATSSEILAVDNVLYSTKSVTPYGVIKWDESLLNDNGVAISAEVFFRKVEDKDFNTFNTYRYLDLMFKNLTGRITATIKEDANDFTTAKTKVFYIGQAVEDEEGALGEITTGQYLIGDSFGETVLSSPFNKQRLSFLSKAQSLRIGLANNSLNETFTIAAYSLMGMKHPRRMFKPGGIISIA